MPRETPDVIGAVERVQAWARQHRLLVDALFAVLIAATAFTDVLSSDVPSDARDFDALAATLIVVACTALVWRRSHALATMAVVVAMITPYYILNYGSFMSVAGIVTVFSVAAHENNRRIAWIAAIAYSLWIFAVACFTLLDEAEGFNTANAANMATYVVGGMIGGAVVRNRQRLFADSERRAEQAERDRVAEADRAVAEERIRIAREMHDVVAHGMSVITVQAAAGQSVVHTDADAANEALVQIEKVGRESLNEMRRMLGVLRGSDKEMAKFEPQPRLRDVQLLVEHCNEAGLPTELTVDGHERELPHGIGLTAYRIVQEALTNVMRHAGPAATAQVHFTGTPGTLDITISDDGRGAVTSLDERPGGNGLIGMRERVAAYDGDFHAGPRAGGGYEVKAVLPLNGTNRPAVADAGSVEDIAALSGVEQATEVSR